MFSSAFREFETDPFFDFGNSPFSRHPFFREDQGAERQSRRHAAPAPPHRPQLPPAEPDDAPADPSGRALVPAAPEKGRQLERHDDEGRRRRRDPDGYAGGALAEFPPMLGGFGAMERHFSQMMDGMQRMMADMGDRMRQMEAAAAREDFDGHMYSHASVYSRRAGENGAEPHIYQAMSETRAGPGGVRETRRAMRDSRSRDERVAHGRHIGARGHVVERRRNVGTGDQREDHSYSGIGETEGDAFDQEWHSRATALDERHRGLLRDHRRAAAAPPERPAIEAGGSRHKL